MWKFLFAGAFALFAQAASADLSQETKLFQVGGPETRTRCINLLKTKGLPSCTIKGYQVRCHDNWIKTCSEWATDFKQHEVFLVASGPDSPEKVLTEYLKQSLETALASAAAAAAVTPGEVAAKAAAAIAAFKVSLYASLSVKPALDSLKDKYTLTINEKSHW